jgi:hypothetical protein
MHDEVRRGSFAVEDRAVGFIEISLTRDALKLAPGLAAGMAIGPNIAQAESAVIGAIGIGTEMASRIDGALAAPVEADEWRW